MSFNSFKLVKDLKIKIELNKLKFENLEASSPRLENVEKCVYQSILTLQLKNCLMCNHPWIPTKYRFLGVKS